MAMAEESSWALIDKLEQAVHSEQPQTFVSAVKVDMLRSIYRQMDNRRTGHISKQDLASLLRKIDPTITTQRVTALLKKISTDGNDEVSFEEFVEFYTKYQEQGSQMSDDQADVVKATFRAHSEPGTKIEVESSQRENSSES
ncbi:Calmodulin-4 (Calcium-binding protein Dd112) [Durusdinium trenchii]|uniref:Calmodulin-4 (Calcium-binding protein Dd112) n=1 Tax=Durusdinium trenchii TaxID=1381693 RepID=A0ABP0R3A7_9DINO